MNQRRQTSSSPARQLTRAVKASKVPAISRAAAVLRLLGKSAAPFGADHPQGISVFGALHLGPATVRETLRISSLSTPEGRIAGFVVAKREKAVDCRYGPRAKIRR
jgi:hypothetical protein